jgi:ribonucleoside-diphosphate reductase alpha chain
MVQIDIEGRIYSRRQLKFIGGRVMGTASEVFQPLRRRLPDERQAITRRFVIDGHKGYVTVGMYDDRTPGEIFITVAKEGSTLSGLLDAFAVSVSMALQHGLPLRSLLGKFCSARYEPSGRTSDPCIPFATSITDYIFRWLGLKFLSLEGMQEVGVVSRCEECGKALTCDGRTYPCLTCVAGVRGN